MHADMNYEGLSRDGIKHQAKYPAEINMTGSGIQFCVEKKVNSIYAVWIKMSQERRQRGGSHQ